MKLLYFFIIFLAQTVLAIEVGDYVSYPGPGITEFGTVLERSEKECLIRPHRTQGDFSLPIKDITLVKMVQELKLIKPQRERVSINLMWVKKKSDEEIFIFPTTKLTGSLEKLAEWALATKAPVVLWYDSLMVHKDAKRNTEIFLDRFHHDIAKLVTFRDLRELVSKEDFDIFSEETPVYVRVDLYRALSAYKKLLEEAFEGRYYFIYADMDMPAMPMDQLFDASTMMDLDQYGIVMAHCDGQEGNKPFENGFQIISNNKPNLFLAMKHALIDINIMRIRHAKKHGVTPEISWMFESYRPMFALFYQLEGLAHITNVATTALETRLADTFGLEKVNPIEVKIRARQLLFRKKYFDHNGKETIFEALYYPKKVVDIPPSQFGGTPTVFNPQELTPRNYPEQLQKELKKQQIDPRFLKIAQANNYVYWLERIQQKATRSR